MNIQISSDFRKKTIRAILTIVLFILVYVALLMLAIGITILCVMGGIGLIMLKPMVLTVGVGVGLASMGFLVLIFLFKFLFKKHKTDRSHLIEVKESEQPQLFSFIRKIVDEVETDFPKKIYLSGSVNACVFYDSSFWSMFFPVRKNLEIGLGLVSTISEQEFKAILAHEFGHFSQKSMKVGSYVYNVNQIIYNMLFDNESYHQMIQHWAEISGYFAPFVALAVGIINGIQWVLNKMYGVVNISYMALSREMEFHADEIAANVAGSAPLKDSLLRMDLADYSFNSVLNFYSGKIEENMKSPNIYSEQQYVLNFLASENNVPFKNNLPLLSETDLSKYNKSKLNIKDQWASHPGVVERITALERLNIEKPYEGVNAASQLFSGIESIQKKLTDNIFLNVNYKDKALPLSIEKFKHEYSETYNKTSLPKKYNGYYDNKNPGIIDIESVTGHAGTLDFELLFSKENVDLIYTEIALQNDKNVLTAIAENKYSVKTFDYDGQKYYSKDAKDLIEKIEEDITVTKRKIEENDILIYHFFYQEALKKGNEKQLKEKYAYFSEQSRQYEQKLTLYNNLLEATGLLSTATSIAQLDDHFKVISIQEVDLRSELKIMLADHELEEEITKIIREKLENYISKDWVYFNFKNETYYNDNLQVLYDAINNYHYLLSRKYFIAKLKVLTFQLQQLNH